MEGISFTQVKPFSLEQILFHVRPSISDDLTRCIKITQYVKEIKGYTQAWDKWVTESLKDQKWDQPAGNLPVLSNQNINSWNMSKLEMSKNGDGQKGAMTYQFSRQS